MNLLKDPYNDRQAPLVDLPVVGSLENKNLFPYKGIYINSTLFIIIVYVGIIRKY
jgi:hypothetical protein